MSRHNWYEMGPFTVFDLETTGMSAVNDRIVELAALRIDLDGTTQQYQSLINPGCYISHRVIAIHNITNEMVADAPKFSQVAYEFLEFAAGTTLVAHNGKFDLSFLQESLYRSGLPLWDGKVLDTLRLSKSVFNNLPSYSLQNLRRSLGLPDTAEMMQAHRAMSEVLWTVELLRGLLEEVLRHNSGR